MKSSKITIKESITVFIGILAVWNVIPKAFEAQVLETVTIVSPIIGIVLRQWFSSSTIVWDDQ